jgi:hypothetical protein
VAHSGARREGFCQKFFASKETPGAVKLYGGAWREYAVFIVIVRRVAPFAPASPSNIRSPCLLRKILALKIP